MPERRLPRPLHPLAWWCWALGLAAAATRTTNPLLLLLVIAVAAQVVAARRTDAPWARSFRSYLVFGAVVVVVRVGFYLAVGARTGSTVLFRLPSIELPEWAAGISLGGPISAEGLLAAATDGLRLATLLVCVGAANSLANPKRLLRCVPAALHEVGTTVVVTLSAAPQLAESVQRVRRARTLRGGVNRGHGAVRAIAVPVLADALERSLALAAAMDSRGYGRRGDLSRQTRTATGALVIGGLLAICAGTYGILDGTAPAALGLPVLAAGTAVAVGGFALAGRRTRPTTYRPDPWRWEEWAVLASGAVPAVLLTLAARVDPEDLYPLLDPLAWPSLGVLPAAAVLVGLLPAVLAPPPEPRPSAAAAVTDTGWAGRAHELRPAHRPAPADSPTMGAAR